MEVNDTYKTVKEDCEGIYKSKGSKFIAYIYPVTEEIQIKKHIEELKKSHHSARHHCYAYRLGHSKDIFKYNDDGEPSNTAGKPIFGQILSADITNVLIVVVRYFGGTKLGVGGLITAYKSAAADGIANSTIIEKIVQEQITITCEYPLLNSAMRIIKEMDLTITDQSFEMDCSITVEVRQTLHQEALAKLNYIEGVTAK